MEIEFGNRLNNITYIDRHAAYGLIFNALGEVAVVSVKGKNRYFLPGGGIEAEENQVECLTRECIEEIGYEVKVGDFLGEASYYSFCNPLKCYLKSIGHFYFAEIVGANNNKVEEDHELLWKNPEAAANNMFLAHQAWAIKKALEILVD